MSRQRNGNGNAMGDTTRYSQLMMCFFVDTTSSGMRQLLHLATTGKAGYKMPMQRRYKESKRKTHYAHSLTHLPVECVPAAKVDVLEDPKDKKKNSVRGWHGRNPKCASNPVRVKLVALFALMICIMTSRRYPWNETSPIKTELTLTI